MTEQALVATVARYQLIIFNCPTSLTAEALGYRKQLFLHKERNGFRPNKTSEHSVASHSLSSTSETIPPGDVGLESTGDRLCPQTDFCPRG